ncbi:TlpA family protein disulfide reductase [Roseivirga pacifica]|uniref:TlpA family protein disulfide reductase n=1 Tax=Roseivirga pacifica TaxID=1267423 RepID=UPI003BAF5B3A
MKRITILSCVMLCITLLTQAQINFSVRRVDNNESVDLETLITDDSGNHLPTFLVTWSGEWCFPCMDVIQSLDNAAKSGMVQLLALNVDDDWTSIKANNYHSNWTNTTNLYLDTELNGPFSSYFNTSSAPVIMFFNDEGAIQYMDISYNVRSYMFADYFGKEFIWEDYSGLNTYAWNYYLEHADSESTIDATDSEMATALEYVKRSIELSPGYSNTDTYAALLYLTGQYTEALKTAKEAIDIAKANEEDYETTNELIQKIIEKM